MAKIDEVIDEIYNNYDLNELFTSLTEMFMGAIPSFDAGDKDEKKSFKVVR